MTTFEMSLAVDRDLTLTYEPKLNGISEEEVIKRGKTLQGRLAAICPGFFEVHRKEVTKPVDDPKQAWRDLAISVRHGHNRARTIRYVGEYEPWKSAKVEFIHRTASDFLSQERIKAYLVKITSEEGFHPLESLLQSCVHQTKSFPCQFVLGFPSGEMGEVISQAFKYSWHLEKQTGRIPTTLLDELDKTIRYRRKQVRLWNSMRNIPISDYARIEAYVPFEQYEPFTGMAARNGLYNYVKYKISEFDISSSEPQARPLLFSLLSTGVLGYRAVKQPLSSADLVKLLLDEGEDLNICWYGLTAWAYACVTFSSLWFKLYHVGPRHYADIMTAMILAGADTNVLIQHDNTRVLSPISMIKQCA